MISAKSLRAERVVIQTSTVDSLSEAMSVPATTKARMMSAVVVTWNLALPEFRLLLAFFRYLQKAFVIILMTKKQ